MPLLAGAVVGLAPLLINRKGRTQSGLDSLAHKPFPGRILSKSSDPFMSNRRSLYDDSIHSCRSSAPPVPEVLDGPFVKSMGTKDSPSRVSDPIHKRSLVSKVSGPPPLSGPLQTCCSTRLVLCYISMI